MNILLNVSDLFKQLLALLARPFEYVVKVLGFQGGKTLNELKVYEIAIAIAVIYVLFLAVKALFKSVKGGTSVIRLGYKKIHKSHKEIASKLICHKCGRTLDRCTCEENKGVSLRKRIKKYKKQVRELNKERKLAEKASKKAKTK